MNNASVTINEKVKFKSLGESLFSSPLRSESNARAKTEKPPALSSWRSLFRSSGHSPAPDRAPTAADRIKVPAVQLPVKPRGQRILLVEDDALTQKVISQKLKSEGFEVLAVSEGAAAIRSARHDYPDLILLDLSLPSDMALSWDGFLLMNWLRRLEETRRIPIIVISGGDPEQYQKRCLSCGAAAYFQKPVRHESLVEKIEQILSGVRSCRSSAEFQI